MKLFISRTFQWWEVSLLKICLISLGILVGLYFTDYVVGLTWLWWILFAATAIYFIARFFSEG
jgi:hypothetical protein